MIVHKHAVAGEPVTINVVEREEDLDGFRDFIRGNLRCLALDSETTGLDVYSDGFRCRLVQFGSPTEAYVIPVEAGARFQEDVRVALHAVQQLVLQNASYDLQVFERTLGTAMEELWPKVVDTKILAHLVDPRPVKEGGTGHSLEDLTRHYLDAEVADNVKGLMNVLRLRHKTTKQYIWSKVELFDPDYNLYAGMDPILAARLLRKLIPLVPKVSEPLISYEHKLAEICSYIERQGFLLDEEYSRKLSDRMRLDQEVWEAIAFTEYGVDNVNSTQDCAEALEVETGVRITERTPSGDRKVDKVLLEKLIAEGNKLAEIIAETKRLGKWRTTWVDGFLAGMDAGKRCHAHINPLQARTARMSITGIPAQTLPAGDWMVRRCFLAEDGHRIASVDYQSQELRVLAALSGDLTMIRAFKADADLHQITADASGVDRKIGKMTNVLTVYGGGAGKLAKSAGIDFPTAKRVVDGFAATYPGVTQFSQDLQLQARETGSVITPMGRVLPVDEDRGYAALNYMVQSTSRDVTAKAMLRLHEAGFTPNIRLAIHDEILASVPAEHAEWGAKRIAEIMAEQMGPVSVGTDAEVYGRSWGHGYMDEEQRKIADDQLRNT